MSKYFITKMHSFPLTDRRTWSNITKLTMSSKKRIETPPPKQFEPCWCTGTSWNLLPGTPLMVGREEGSTVDKNCKIYCGVVFHLCKTTLFVHKISRFKFLQDSLVDIFFSNFLNSAILKIYDCYFEHFLLHYFNLLGAAIMLRGC